MMISCKDSRNDIEASKALEMALTQIRIDQIDSAMIYTQRAKLLYVNQSINEAINLEKELLNFQSNDYLEDVLSEMSDEEFENLVRGKFSQEYFTQSKLNLLFIDIMKGKSAERDMIIRKKREERKARELAEEKRQNEYKKTIRKQEVEKQFSGWDGSHRGLVSLIKEKMNDPSSYDHIETRFRDDGSTIFVITKFRGKNAFGGKVINQVSARVDFEGNVVEIISQN